MKSEEEIRARIKKLSSRLKRMEKKYEKEKPYYRKLPTDPIGRFAIKWEIAVLYKVI